MDIDMMVSVCMVLLVTVWQASSQAPGDEDQRCLNERAQANDIYPPFTKMLMDSRNYEELISGSRPNWQQLDVDGTGFGWTSTLGGLCAYEARVCDFRESMSQDNWVFTQYISYLEAKQVFVNVSAGFTECRLAQNPPCNQLYVDVYRYERNGRDDAAARNTSNYGQPIERIQQPNGFAQRTYRTSFPFNNSNNFNGFYIGVRATGTCINIQRLQVYYRASPRRTDGLVTYPEIALPILGSTTAVTGIATCAANSHNTTSLLITCFANGTCEVNTNCACNPGYEYVASIPAQCTACPAGTYRSRSDPADSCLPCPANTDQSGVAVAICPCIAGYYRSAQEGPNFSCTQPPTAVRNLTVIDTTNTSITIEWQPPEEIGRDDCYYNVEHSDPNDISKYIQHEESINCSDTTMYDVTGLQPITTYIIRISVHNGVSGNDSQNDDRRRRQINGTTQEGIPNAPTNVRGLCNVIVWGKPSRTNGNLTEYNLRFYDNDNDREIIVSNRSDEILRIVKRSDIPSDSTDDIFVQVRGRTRAGDGNWSEGVPLGCDEAIGQGLVPGASTGYIETWYLGVVAAGSSLLTAIIVILIVLIVVCICTRSKKETSDRCECDNPMYSK